MKAIGVTIKTVLELDERMAQEFERTPRGSLLLAGTGLEQFTIGLGAGLAVEPSRIWVTVEDVAQEREEEFLED
jgi:hypothetical protein